MGDDLIENARGDFRLEVRDVVKVRGTFIPIHAANQGECTPQAWAGTSTDACTSR
jgi:hypothetical protein